MTDWLFDLGNTRLKVAALVPGEDRHGPAEAFAHAELPEALGTLGMSPGDRAWFASVGPEELAGSIQDQLLAAGLRVQRVRTLASEGALRVAYAKPERLGVDRFLALLAASARSDGPWVIVSAGSALTADVLAADGTHLGGVIAPTAAHMQAMLGARFPALEVALRRARATRSLLDDAPPETPALGEDTVEAIIAGTMHSQLGLVERVLAQARMRLAREPLLLLTGGDADALRVLDAPRQRVAPTLVLEGLARFARARIG